MKTKRIVAIGLCAAIAGSSSTASFAARVPTQPLRPAPNVRVARYANVIDWDCTLDITGSDSVHVFAWTRFTGGQTCAITVQLRQNGKTIKTWPVTSTKGYVSVKKDVTGLQSGEYEAVLFFTCGNDSGSMYSGSESL